MDFGGGSSPAPPAPLPEPIVTDQDLADAARREAQNRRRRRGRDSLTVAPTGIMPQTPAGGTGNDYPPMP